MRSGPEDDAPGSGRVESPVQTPLQGECVLAASPSNSTHCTVFRELLALYTGASSCRTKRRKLHRYSILAFCTAVCVELCGNGLEEKNIRVVEQAEEEKICRFTKTSS